MTYVLHWLPSVDLCEWTSLNILRVWLTQCPLPNLTSCHEDYLTPPHIHLHLSTHICAYSNMNTAWIQTTHDDCVPFWGAICCIKELSYKETHPPTELQTSRGWSGRGPEEESTSRGFTCELSSANRLQRWAHSNLEEPPDWQDCSQRLSPEWLCETQPYLEAVNLAYFPSKAQTFSSLFGLSMQLTDRCCQTLPWLLHALFCLRWNLARFLNNGVNHRKECLRISGLFRLGLV